MNRFKFFKGYVDKERFHFYGYPVTFSTNDELLQEIRRFSNEEFMREYYNEPIMINPNNLFRESEQ
jgi:hypothetical protein